MHQRRALIRIVVRLHRGSRREQHPHGLDMTALRRPQQRAIAIVVAMIDRGAAREQQARHFHMAVAGREHQRRIGLALGSSDRCPASSSARTSAVSPIRAAVSRASFA